MKIKLKSLTLNNVIYMEQLESVSTWITTAEQLRNFIVEQGYYPTGPIFFQVSKSDNMKKEKEYKIYIPVNKAVIPSEDSSIIFLPELKIKNGLQFRHFDIDEPLENTYQLLRACAESNNIELVEPFYNFYVDVYGEGIIDVFAPIKE